MAAVERVFAQVNAAVCTKKVHIDHLTCVEVQTYEEEDVLTQKSERNDSRMSINILILIYSAAFNVNKSYFVI